MHLCKKADGWDGVRSTGCVRTVEVSQNVWSPLQNHYWKQRIWRWLIATVLHETSMLIQCRKILAQRFGSPTQKPSHCHSCRKSPKHPCVMIWQRRTGFATSLGWMKAESSLMANGLIRNVLKCVLFVYVRDFVSHWRVVQHVGNAPKKMCESSEQKFKPWSPHVEVGRSAVRDQLAKLGDSSRTHGIPNLPGVCNHLSALLPGYEDRFLVCPYGLLWHLGKSETLRCFLYKENMPLLINLGHQMSQIANIFMICYG